MTEWEYRFVHGNKGRHLEGELNELGRDGWEAVGMTLEPGIAFRRVSVLLKRPTLVEHLDDVPVDPASQ